MADGRTERNGSTQEEPIRVNDYFLFENMYIFVLGIIVCVFGLEYWLLFPVLVFCAFDNSKLN